MKLPIKDNGRNAHHKPNNTIFLQSNEYRIQKKRDFTPQRSDPLATDKTHPNRAFKSTYSDTFQNEKNTSQSGTHVSNTRSQVSDLSPLRVPKASPRYANPSPRINKANDFAYYNLDNVPRGKSDEEFKRDLRKQGIDPVSVNMYKDPITHQSNGKAFMVMNANETKTNDVRQKLENNGITMSNESKLKRVYHH